MKKVTLRDYQSDLVTRTLESRHLKRILIQSPTGSGKSITMSKTICDLMRVDPQPLFLVAHRKELLDNVAGVLENLYGIPVSRHPSKPSVSGVTVCSMTTLSQWLRKNPRFVAGHLIIDEAHRSLASTYVHCIEAAQGLVVGYTATPIRTDNKPLGDVYNELIGCMYTEYDLIQKGFLCPYQLHYQEVYSINSKSESTVEREGRVKAMEYLDSMADHIKETYRRHKSIVFCGSVDIANELRDRVGAGFVVSGKTKKSEREKTLEYLRSGGPGTIVFNVSLYVEGLDVPSIDAVYNTVDTVSISKLWQLVGRMMRISPGKDWGYLYDYTSTPARLPMPGDYVDWSLEGLVKAKKRTELFEDEEDQPIRLASENTPNYLFLEPLVTEMKGVAVNCSASLSPFLDAIVPLIVCSEIVSNGTTRFKSDLVDLKNHWQAYNNAPEWLEQNFGRLVTQGKFMAARYKKNPEVILSSAKTLMTELQEKGYPELISTNLTYTDILLRLCN